MSGYLLLRHSIGLLGSADTRLLLSLNSIFSIGVPGKILDFFGRNPIARGFPIFLPLIGLWLSADRPERRIRMLAGLLASFVAVFLSVWMQYHITSHTRPFLDATLHIKDQLDAQDWDHLNSFPSDSATLYFSLSMVVFLESRTAGGIAFLWSLFTVGFIRVAEGWHYPSDIAGGFILATTLVYLFTRIGYLRYFLEHLLQVFERRVYVLHALVFLYLADAYSLFPGLQGIVHALRNMNKQF